MKKLSVVDRLSAAGRLTRRYEALVSDVEGGKLSRMEAGDRILREVIEPLGEPRTPLELQLAFEAGATRADLYHRSHGATPLDTAAAIEGAWSAHGSLPRDPRRAARVLPVAADLFDSLEELGSRQTRFRILRLMLEAAEQSGEGAALARRVLPGIPQLLRDLSEVRDDPGVEEMLAKLKQLLGPAAPADALAALDREAFTLALRRGDGDTAMRRLGERGGFDPEAAERLALLLADQGRRDAPARSFWHRFLKAAPDRAAGLELSLRRAATPHPERAKDLLDEYEQFNQTLLPAFPDAAWPCKNLAIVASLRGQSDVFLAALAAAMDRGYRGEDSPGFLASHLDSLGFGRTAATLLANAGDAAAADPLARHLRVLHQTERALRQKKPKTPLSTLSDQLEDAGAAIRLSAGAAARVEAVQGALLVAHGDALAAARRFERALGHLPRDKRLPLDLAQLYLLADDPERAMVWLEHVQSADPVRSGALRAQVLESRGDLRGALDALLVAIRIAEDPDEAFRGERFRLLVRVRESFRNAGFGDPERSTTLGRLAKEARRRRHLVREWTVSPDDLRREATRLARSLDDRQAEALAVGPLGERPGAARDLVIAAARAHLGNGDVKRAEKLWKRLKRRDGSGPEVLAGLGLCAVAAGNERDAHRLLSRAVDQGEDDPVVILALSWCHLQLGEAETALNRLDALARPMSAALKAESFRLRALALERCERPAEAHAARREALRLEGDEVTAVAQSRLGIWLGLEALDDDPAAARDLIRDGLGGLPSGGDEETCSLRALACLALDRDPDAADLEGTTAFDGQATIQMTGRYREALRRRMIRRHLVRGRTTEARRLAQELIGPDAEDLGEALTRFEAMQWLARFEEQRDAGFLESVSSRLDEAGKTPSVAVARELIYALGGPAVADATYEEVIEAPGRLRLALARAHLVTGRRLDRVRTLVDELVHAEGRLSEESRLVLLLLEPDTPPSGLDAMIEAADKSTLLLPEETRGLLARACYLRGQTEALEGSLRGGTTSLHRQVEGALRLAESLEEVRPEGDPVRLGRSLAAAEELLEADHAALPGLKQAAAQVEDELQGMTLANFAELASRPIEARADVDLVAAAEQLCDREPGFEARHHMVLALHEQAFDLAGAGAETSLALFERAHAAWNDLLTDAEALAALAPDQDAGMRRAAADLARDWLLEAQLGLAARLVEEDPERSAAHARLALRSPLARNGTEQLRCDLYVALTGDLDPAGGMHERSRLRGRLQVLLQADPENLEGLRLTLGVEARALDDALEPLRRRDMKALPLDAIHDAVAGASFAIRPLQDDAETWSSTADLAKDLATWQLGFAVIRAHKEQENPAARKAVREAIATLEAAGLEDERCSIYLAWLLASHARAVIDDPGREVTREWERVDESLLLDPHCFPGRLLNVRRLLAVGALEQAALCLESLYIESTARDERDDFREIVLKLHDTRERLVVARRESRIRMAQEFLASARHSDLLQVSGGKTSDPMIDPEIAICRVRALMAMGRGAVAEREFQRLQERARRERFVLPELGELRLHFGIARGVSRCGRDLQDAYDLMMSGKSDRALPSLVKLAARYPREPWITVLRARALARQGMSEDARFAASEALAQASPEEREIVGEALADLNQQPSGSPSDG